MPKMDPNWITQWVLLGIQGRPLDAFDAALASQTPYQVNHIYIDLVRFQNLPRKRELFERVCLFSRPSRELIDLLRSDADDGYKEDRKSCLVKLANTLRVELFLRREAYPGWTEAAEILLEEEEVNNARVLFASQWIERWIEAPGHPHFLRVLDRRSITTINNVYVEMVQYPGLPQRDVLLEQIASFTRPSPKLVQALRNDPPCLEKLRKTVHDEIFVRGVQTPELREVAPFLL